MSTTFATIDDVTHRFVVQKDGTCFLNSAALPLQVDDPYGQFTVNFIKYEEKVYLVLYDNKKLVLQFYDMAGRCIVHCDLMRTLGEHVNVHYIQQSHDYQTIVLIRRECENLKFRVQDAFARVLDRSAFVPTFEMF